MYKESIINSTYEGVLKMIKKYNVLFFFTDDQRFDTIAALGNPEIKTPNIDQLVHNGTAFTHAHISGGTVGAVCMPSRGMLNTGKSLFHLENSGSNIPEGHTLLGECLQKAGYRTFGTGKWHNGSRSYARSFTDGADIFFGGMGDHWNVQACDFDPAGIYDKESSFIPNPYHSNAVGKIPCDHIHPGKHSSELFCETAVKWLDNYDNENPFYMYISFMAPHDPRSMPEEFLNMYDPEKISLPENFISEHQFDYGVRDIRDEMLTPYPRTPLAIKKHIAEYYGMISHLDNELGKVIDTLKRTGKYEDTIIVFSSDNGLALGQHGLMGKQSAYEHSIRVPLIFSGPGIPKNEKRNTYVYLMDIFPTICDLTGIEIPQSVEGIGFATAIRDKDFTVRKTLYFAYVDLLRAVKDEQFKLIEFRNDGINKTLLFDLKTDLWEMNNLYGKAEYLDIAYRLKNELKKHKEEWEDEKHPTGKKFWGLYDIKLETTI